MTKITLSFFTLFAFQVAFAQSSGEQGQSQRPHGPPPEAIEACSGSSADAACSFTGRRGETLSGSCFEGPQGLACRPEGHRPRQREGKQGSSSKTSE